jgi:hypothetical protein
MAGRTYWTKFLPLVLAPAGTVTAALAADPMLNAYSRYYRNRFGNMRASMGGGANPIPAAEDAATVPGAIPG